MGRAQLEQGFFFQYFRQLFDDSAMRAELKKNHQINSMTKILKKEKKSSLIIGNVALSALSITRVDYKYLQPTITNTANVQKNL